MRKALILASLALGTAAMAAVPMDASIATGRVKSDLAARQNMTGNETPNSVAPKSGDREVNELPAYDYDAVEVGYSRYDYQHNGSYNKMVAISSDGVAHGVFMGGTDIGSGRRVRSWCVGTDLTLTNPQDVAAQHSGYTSIAVTSGAPANGLGADSGVPAFHTSAPAASWFGVDFFGCTLAFQLVQSTTGLDILWPHVAVDYQDKVHVVSGDAGTVTPDAVYYKASADGASWDTDWVTVTDNSNTLSYCMAAAKNAPAAAVLFMQNAPAGSPIFDDATYGASQWHHDIFYYEARDASTDLATVIEGGEVVNVTNYGHADSDAPFAFGNMAYADIDAIYDAQESPNLHIAWSAPVAYADSMLYIDPLDDTMYYTAFSNIDYATSIWHYNATTGTYGHIAGWSTSNGEWFENADGDYEVPGLPDPGVFRIPTDRVQLAVDRDTGYLYALWNVYTYDDVRDAGDDALEMPNGELFMACSADNGETWGPRVNITNTQTPGCLVDECLSETFGSLAEFVDNGYLHVTFMVDTHAGSSIRNTDANDGSVETENPYAYMRIPVGDVPPHSGQAWDAPGRVGFFPYSRQWWFTDGHLDTIQMVDPINIFNESTEDVYVDEVIMYHDMLDDFSADNADLWYMWEVLDGDPNAPGAWIENPAGGNEWDGMIPARTARRVHVSVGHNVIPTREQAFKFVFSNGQELAYRFMYSAANGEGYVNATMEMDNLDLYESIVLYDRGVVGVDDQVQPVSFELMQNVPNPFNPTTQISFTLNQVAKTSLKVYNVMGQEVATLLDGTMGAGQHTVTFDGSSMTSGVYFYAIEAAGQRETRKMLLAK